MIGIGAGAMTGSLIGAMGYCKIVPHEFRESVTYTTIQICFGLIVAVVDLLCIWGLVKPILDRHIDRHGESVTGMIESLRELPHPDHFDDDEWVRLSRFACVVTYSTDSGKMTKEFPPTPLMSERELYPFAFEEGSEIPIKFLKKHPKLSIIDNCKLKAAYQIEHKKDMLYLVMIPTVITVLYILALVTL